MRGASQESPRGWPEAPASSRGPPRPGWLGLQGGRPEVPWSELGARGPETPTCSRPVTWGSGLGRAGGGAGRRRNLGNLGGAGGLLSSGAAGLEESELQPERSAAMGQIEWAMWANEQALASGLSEWGALCTWGGAAEGLLSLGAGRCGSAGGLWGWEVGAWRPQAARGKGERAGWRRGGSRGPEEPKTPRLEPGVGPRARRLQWATYSAGGKGAGGLCWE